MPKEWNIAYALNYTPWSAHHQVRELIHLIKTHCSFEDKILEVGCGFAEEAIELAKDGYQITAIDLSPIAIEQAKQSAASIQCNIILDVCDFLSSTYQQIFKVVYDIQVLPPFETFADKRAFVNKIHASLICEGLWINISIIKNQQYDDFNMNPVLAPPAISEDEILELASNKFTLLARQNIHYKYKYKDVIFDLPAQITLLKKR